VGDVEGRLGLAGLAEPVRQGTKGLGQVGAEGVGVGRGEGAVERNGLAGDVERRLALAGLAEPVR
jgi:hypothetical protein